MKICFTCGIEKSFSEFKRDPRLADGCVNKCDLCEKIYEQNRRKAQKAWIPRNPLGPPMILTLAMAMQAKEAIHLGAKKKAVAAMFGIHEATLRKGMKAHGLWEDPKADKRIPYEAFKANRDKAQISNVEQLL